MPWTYLAPIMLLFCSNVFMTFAWVRRDQRRVAARAKRSSGPF